jgi:hypothetical protein
VRDADAHPASIGGNIVHALGRRVRYVDRANLAA